MRRLLPFLNGYKKESIIGPLFKLLEATFELIVPLIMAQIIDVGIRHRNVPYIWKMGAVLVVFGVLGDVYKRQALMWLTAVYFWVRRRISGNHPQREQS